MAKPMTKLDWEKANRKEAVRNSSQISISEIQPLKKCKESVAAPDRPQKRKSDSQIPDPQHCAQVAKHAKKRKYQKTYYARLRAKVNKLESNPPFNRGVESGKIQERERIIQLLTKLEQQHQKVLELAPNRTDQNYRHAVCQTLQQAVALIKGEQK